MPPKGKRSVQRKNIKKDALELATFLYDLYVSNAGSARLKDSGQNNAKMFKKQ
jgi:hypothetical protein